MIEDEVRIEHIDDLNYLNYKKHADSIVSSITTIAAVAGISITDLARLTNLSYKTLKKAISGGKSSFKTYSKLNNAIKTIAFTEQKEIKMNVSFKPLSNRVLVKQAPVENVSSGGIIIPDSAEKNTAIGLVEAVGPGKSNNGNFISPIVKIGDSVLFGKFSGTKINLKGEEYLIIKEDEILGIV